MKRAWSVIVVLAFMLTLSAPVYAVSLTPEADCVEITAGQDIVVTLSLDESLSNVLLLEGQLFYRPDLFDYTCSEINPEYDVTIKPNTDTSGQAYLSLVILSPLEELPAGKLCDIIFTAKENITAEQTAEFKTLLKTYEDDEGNSLGSENSERSITVSVKPLVSGYSVALDPDRETVNPNETVYVNILVSADEHSKYNAADMHLSYSGIVYDEARSVIPDSASVSDNNGSLRIRIFGADKSFSDAFKLAFTAAGDGSLTLLSAKIDNDARSDAQDAPTASLTDSTVLFDVEISYSVALPDSFTGAATVKEGETYRFTAKDIHYDHTVTATMGGTTVAVTAGDNGVYTIPNVTGDLVIQADSTPKTFAVTVKGSAVQDVDAEQTATYLSDYTFTVTKAEDYSYENPVITIDGNAFTAYTTSDSSYTIPGASITGDIVITLEKEEIPPETVTVSFDGDGAADAHGEKSVAYGSHYTFTLHRADGYVYTVTATMDGKTVPVIENTDGTYTVENVTDALTIRIDKTGERNIDVHEYIKLPDTSILYLITAGGTLEDGQVFTYNESVMHHSEQYNKYVWLVISKDAKPAVLAEAQEAIGLGSATAEDIDYAGDVNGTGLLDINDAQLVYNMYMAKYTDFSQVSMMKFLRADLNGDHTVDINDAVAVIYNIE